MFIIYLLIFAISISFSWITVPLVNDFAKKNYLYNKPSKRSQKKSLIVRLGGIGIFIGLLGGITTSLFFGNPNIEFSYLICFGSIMFFLIGFADDIKSISPLFRLFLQFLTGIIIWFNGFRIETLNLSWFVEDQFIIFLPQFLSLAITVIWISGVINSINWIDGLDGLLGGFTVITCFNLIIIAIIMGNTFAIFSLISLIGASIGFLNYNVYPAKILMGDCGSYLIGFNLAILSCIVTSDINNNINIFFAASLLFIPLGDMLFVIFKRLFKGREPYLPDRNHIHHRILRLGINHRNTVIFIVLLAQILNFLILSITI